MPTPDIAARRSAFRALHERGCFVVPNPWDVGTARCLGALGFPALATTSAGLAYSLGRPDAPTALPRDAVLDHVRRIVCAVDLPVNADFQSGYAADADGVAESVGLCIETGAAGLSIEDATGRADRPLFELSEALDRLRAARAAIDASGRDVLLTGRAECYLAGHPDPLRESIRRLQAYAEAGADVLYAPGPRDPADIRAIVAAVSPRPVNVLVSAGTALRVADLAALGVRRVSVGSALSRVAWGAFLRAARGLAEEGRFTDLDGAAPFAEMNAMFAGDARRGAC